MNKNVFVMKQNVTRNSNSNNYRWQNCFTLWKVTKIVGDIRESFRNNLQGLDWMDSATRKKAIDKVISVFLPTKCINDHPQSTSILYPISNPTLHEQNSRDVESTQESINTPSFATNHQLLVITFKINCTWRIAPISIFHNILYF